MAANVNAVACQRPITDTSANLTAAGAPPPPPPMHKKCTLDEHGCVCLADILTSFNAPLSEEQAWALCFECARCFERAVRTDRDACYLVEKVDHVFVHKDGLVHTKTILGSGNHVNSNNEENGRTRMTSERKLVEFLGVTIFDALDYGLHVEEERLLSPDLKTLILAMAACDDEDGQTERSSAEGSSTEGCAAEADDEGIERDSGENDEDSHLFSLTGLIKSCCMHLGVASAQQADGHYRAVCRALVAEALELSSFLEVVSRGRQPHTTPTTANFNDAHVVDLDQLKFADWARLWGQVIRELRHGVQLKKVHYSRAPVEFELTPYEILMEDIRARRYTLNKVGCTLGDIPHTVKKDAHALILEFIRSRPPLRRCADRPLPPLVRVPTPREQLMDSIKRGKTLRPTPIRRTAPRPNSYTPDVVLRNGSIDETSCRGGRRPAEKKRITVDFELLKMGDADEDDLELTTRSRTSTAPAPGPAPWHRTGTSNGCVENSGPLSQDVYHSYCDRALEPYDLATQCPSRRAAARRHTIVVCEPLSAVAKSADPLPSPPLTPPATTPPPQSSSPTRAGPGSLGLQLPHLSWSRSSLQEELFQSKQWQQECLSLTLEEIVHIRSVLTKAELESLPVEGQVKENAEKGKVCFLCMKTTFGIFRRRGHKCRLCQRTVCSKCHSQMRIPTEHFAHVPVVALSPSLLASPEEDPGGRSSLTRSIVSRLMAPAMSMDDSSSARNSVGSAPSSPKLGCTTSSEGSPSTGPASLPPLSSAQNTSPAATAAPLKANTYKEKLKGLQMVVCLDCKAMVLQIIKSSRSNRTNAIRSFTLNLSPVY